jgi:4-hydroxybenzoate polyprenyltransferase/phosphoserine phosphatase
MAESRVMHSPETLQRAVQTAERPLCVDLDGTLVKSDTFVDSLMVLARRHPIDLLSLPRWVAKGKAYTKAQLASRVTLDAAHLPYNLPLLNYLRQEHALGRRILLATGADHRLAQSVADHLGIFDEVLASDGMHNFTGDQKLALLEERFGNAGFDYIGNAAVDLPILSGSGEAMVANPHTGLTRALRRRKLTVSREFADRRHPMLALTKALRVHQWAKNLLVFLAMLLAHDLRAPSILRAVTAFACFCCMASATYILNDLLDLETDRLHLTKRTRAFAAGDLSVKTGLGISLGLLVLSLLAAVSLPRTFLLYLLLYLVTTLAYSLSLKRVVLVDVVVLSCLYTIRMVAGSSATGDPVSPWLAGFSSFLFLSLAMVKRFSELQNLHARGANPRNGRGYLLSDLEQLRVFGTSSAYASVVIFSLYINGRDVMALYHHPNRMWAVTPLLILWVSRVWLLASRGVLDEDPVVFAISDRMSLLLGLGILVVVCAAL